MTNDREKGRQDVEDAVNQRDKLFERFTQFWFFRRDKHFVTLVTNPTTALSDVTSKVFLPALVAGVIYQ
jgi:hypothetical protein